MRLARAFTLMELLVVLLIIGIMSTVALRTIDATRDRALFDQTSKELDQIAQAMTGNPDLVYDGRRVDFGFYGDLGRLPTDLRELVQNINNEPKWHGPYLRRALSGDSVGYMYDGWGNPYTYSQTSGTIASLGNGKYPLTVKVADDLPQIEFNTVVGTVGDRDNNTPSDTAAVLVRVAVFPSSWDSGKVVRARPDGLYQVDSIPIGLHRIVAYLGSPASPVITESIARWITVTPRSRVVADFRFSRRFRNRLVLIGGAQSTGQPDAFVFQVGNEGSADDTVYFFQFLSITMGGVPDTTYMHELNVRFAPDTVFSPIDGKGAGDTVVFNRPVVVGPNFSDPVAFSLMRFTQDTLGTVMDTVMGKTFRIQFSDGSEVTVTP